jgi:hypothetical protein
MKYIVTLIVGMLTGAALFALGLAYNPFVGEVAISPLAEADSQTVTLSYSAVASDSVMFTNDGESRISPFPEKVQQLWEAPIRQTDTMVTVLTDSQNQVAGMGIKMASAGESTRLLEGKALVNSVWYVYLPGQGSLFVEQTENYWGYLRDIVLPAYKSSAGIWKGTWTGKITAGPGASGTARVVGGSGKFDGLELLGVESLSVRTWRVSGGPLAADGRLTIELPDDRRAAN